MFLDPADPSCFVDGSCAALATDNQITRSNALYSVDLVLHQAYSIGLFIGRVDGKTCATKPIGRRRIFRSS